MREKITVENAFERKLGSHGGKVILLSHMQCVGPSLWSLSLCQHQQLTNRKTLEGWPSKCLACRATEKDPILRKPFKCLMHGATEKDKSKRPFEH